MGLLQVPQKCAFWICLLSKAKGDNHYEDIQNFIAVCD